MTARVDLRINDSHGLFVRYSHDGNDGFAPPATQSALPSNWSRNQNWSDQSLVSLTSALQPNLTNELRFSYWYWHTRNQTPSSSDCPGCAGLGMPEISILGTDMTAGNYRLTPQGGDFRRYHLADNLTWQVGTHQLRFGGEWQFDRGDGFLSFVEPASLVLYSPQAVRSYNADPSVPPQARIPLPSSFRTYNDLLQLPLAGVNIGFGNATQPPSFGFDSARKDHIARVYFQDRWRLTPRLSVNYGLAYHVQARFANHDLSKPDYLAPLLGSNGLAATARDWNNFAPSIGLAWTPSRDLKTVLRMGAGMYYDLPLASERLQERSTLGPRGTGRVVVDGSLIQNPIPGIPTVPLGRPLSFKTSPTQFTGSHLISILPSIRRALIQQFGDPANTDLSVRNIDVFKQGIGIIADNFVAPYSLHFNVGVQHELARNWVVTADVVLRRSIHQNTGGIDLNRWNSASGPVIPKCIGQQALDPNARCSTGPIGVQFSAGRSRYQGLLLKLDRRWTRRYQLSVAYALASSVGLEQVVSNNNWFEGYGPTQGDRRHTLTVSGVVDLPWGVRLSSISTFASKPPFRAQL
ncbi:MAG: TonB-dependent receptor, partial [Acidobacteriota bacterium]